MNPDQRAALLFSQSVAALGELMAMQQENAEAKRHRAPPVHDGDAFRATVSGITWNAAVGLLNGV